MIIYFTRSAENCIPKVATILMWNQLEAYSMPNALLLAEFTKKVPLDYMRMRKMTFHLGERGNIYIYVYIYIYTYTYTYFI